LEEYLAGVLRGEASEESGTEALKAQAVLARTYALKNMGRHARKGFDFCSTTHCQHYEKGSISPAGGRNFGPFERAVEATRGELLKDDQSQLIEVFYHASCGGRTSGTGRGGKDAQGVEDPFCLAGPHRGWSAVIPARRLLEALQNDPRTQVGGRLDSIKILRRDPAGRALLMAVEGERRKLLNGWDFKLIVGRNLGWNLIKSSWFEVQRAGDSFFFQGRGFGHGRGLCQEGAGEMSRRGNSYRDILQHYFPGARVGKLPSPPRIEQAALGPLRDLLPDSGNPPPTRELRPVSRALDLPRQQLGDSHFLVDCTAEEPVEVAKEVLSILERARAEWERRLMAAGIPLPVVPRREILMHPSTAAFRSATGEPWWTGGVLRGGKIHLQPARLLKARGIFESTVRHEYAHLCVASIRRIPLPRWMEEGLAIHLAGEGNFYGNETGIGSPSRPQLEEILENSRSPEEWKLAYGHAGREVGKMIRQEGEPALLRRIAAMTAPP
jgi:stage II sporulation protein D